ncbi:general amidase [Apiospora marii]|uniref:general amidase n=1 Tax=Apiospora marii TaxID=335849 RepID=UPI0031304A12
MGILSWLSGSQSSRWKQIAETKRNADLAKIPAAWRLSEAVLKAAKCSERITGGFFETLLDKKTLQVTSLDAPDLIQRMNSSELTAVEVVTAFCKRAAYAHQLTSNMLEIDFDNAIRQAYELDVHFQTHGELVGPLHGLPMTFKDQFHVHGLGTSLGFVGWIDTFEGKKGTGKEKVFESQITKELKSLGAVPIGKTSVVVSLWAPETNNNIVGYQLNPHNQALSAGGSSGGEAVMQALRGSTFGIGSDIGGSVTIPSSYTGVFGFKPSSARISMKGVANTAPGQQVMPTSAGIMGPSVGTVNLVLKSLLATKPWLQDPFVVPIPWRDEPEDSGNLTFGIMEHDANVHPHPPVARAMRIAQAALKAAGHELLEWNPPSNNRSIGLHGRIARGDGCPDVWEALRLSDEPLVPQIKSLFPNNAPPSPIPLPQYENLVVDMMEYRQDYQEYWMSSADRTRSGRPVAAIIQPVSPYAGLLPGKYFYSGMYARCRPQGSGAYRN